MYVGFLAVLLNLVVAVLVTALLPGARVPDSPDDTTPEEFVAERGDPRVHEIPEYAAARGTTTE